MSTRWSNGALAAGLLFAVFLWGGNNAGVKFLVRSWPPVWTGGTRFLCAGLLLLVLLRWRDRPERVGRLDRAVRKRLWLGGALSLAAYILAFNWAVRLTAVSHVALYLGAAPVWALLWEGRAGLARREWARRWLAAGLALAGVAALFGPELRGGRQNVLGEALGLGCSVLWTAYGRQTRALRAHLSGPALTAHTMWRAGVLLAPLAALEAATHGIPWNGRLALVQLYCIVGGGVLAFALWNHALRHWKTSEVYLFNNLVPLSTMLWAHYTLGEPMTATFWLAMALVGAGVALAQGSRAGTAP